jgi:hypothetical protein
MNDHLWRRRIAGAWGAWSEFWFAPATADTLALLRIGTGLMLAYMHLIWWWRIDAWMGATSWLDRHTIAQFHSQEYKWSWLWWFDDPIAIRVHQWVAIALSLMMAVGWKTRWSVPLSWWLGLMVAHRMTGMLFGLDQITILLVSYLSVGKSGDRWSIDCWLAGGSLETEQGSSWNRIATRLIQTHLCVIYLFGGLGKLRGGMWWDGSAVWYALASFEYQSLDLTWLGRYPTFVSLATHATLLWELFYTAMVWPRSTRPWVLAMAMAVHAGIAIALGMVTFGVMMMLANLAFIDPEAMRRICLGVRRWIAPGPSDTATRSAPARR